MSEFCFRVEVTTYPPDKDRQSFERHFTAGSIADALRKVATAGDTGLLGSEPPDEITVERVHDLGFDLTTT